MKHLKRFIILLLSLAGLTAKSQTIYGRIIPTYIEPYTIEVSLNKTTNLLFHYRVRNVDRGSDDIIDTLCNDTALLVKANRANFNPTNLSVYTADGRLYAFTVHYNADPEHLAIALQHESAGPIVQPVNNLPVNTDDALEHYCKETAGMPGYWGGHKAKGYGMSLRLKGLYVHSNIMLFPIALSNRSKVGYDIESLRFFIADAKKAKRTATQEVELRPLYVFGETAAIEGKSSKTICFALPKFTLPSGKVLKISLQEKDGGRNLMLRFHNRTVVKAGSL